MLRFEKMVKTFDDFELRMDQIELEKGHIVGIFGRNGAGKSTFFTCLTQLKSLTRGQILLEKETLKPAHKTVICMTLNQYLPMKYTIEKLGKTFCDLYPTFDFVRYVESCDCLQLDRGKKLNQTSKGVKQKVSNLLALCSGCKIICLDEPFDGLDPFARKQMQEMILATAHEENLILIASHQISELELLVDSFIFFDQGNTAFVKDVDELRALTSKDLKQIVKEIEHETIKK